MSMSTAVAKFLYPKVLYEPDLEFPVGFPEDFSQGKMVFFPERKVFVVKETQGFHAISAVCTHLGCMVKWDDVGGVFACPCHGSRFHRDGHNYAGPAPKPLYSYGVSMNDMGQLVVNKGKILVWKDRFNDYFLPEG